MTTATADLALDLMFSKDALRFFKQDHPHFAVTEAHRELAAAALAWAAEVEPTNEYLANIRVVARCKAIDAKNAGIAASIITAYLRHTEQLRARELEASGPKVHVGTVGKRQTFTVKVLGLREMGWDDYAQAPRLLVRMADQDGNVLVWWTTTVSSGGAAMYDAGEGATLTIKGTVKAHDEFKGMPQTVLTRVAVS